MRILSLLALLILTLTGCASTLGIYDTEYDCPDRENGQCLPVEKAMEAAIQEDATRAKETVISDFRPDPVEEEAFLLKDVADFKAILLAYDKCVSKNSISECRAERDKLLNQYASAEDRGRAKELHGVSMQERVAKIAAMEAVVSGGSNTVPVRQPDTIMELHVMPYKTNFGALASERVIWVVVQEGEWTWATTEGKPGARSKLGQTD
jgi:type IV conjugative transfer system lipoprotein TraV